MDSYPEDIIACHEEWCYRLREGCHAKVEIVWGHANFRRLVKRLNLSTLRLWGQFVGIELYLEWGSLLNEGHERFLRRIILFVDHPEYFLRQYDPKVAARQDLKINVAAALAGVEVIPGFFLNRTSSLKRLEDAHGAAYRDSVGYSDEKALWTYQLTLHQLAEQYFETSYSPEVTSVQSFESLPQKMKEWLESDDASFSGAPILNEKAVMEAYREAFNPEERRPDLDLDLRRAVFSLFFRHRSHSQRKMRCRSIADYVQFRIGIIPIKCSGCGPLPDDSIPRFWIVNPKVYVARAFRSCRTTACGRSHRYAVPKDKKIQWLRPDPRLLRRGLESIVGLKSTSFATQIQLRQIRTTNSTSHPQSGNPSFFKALTSSIPPNVIPLGPSRQDNHLKSKYLRAPCDHLVIERQCGSCGNQDVSPDNKPFFWSYDTQFYVAKQSLCCSSHCQEKVRWMIPKRQDLGWIRGSLEYLSATYQQEGQLRDGINRYILAEDDVSYHLRSPVRTKCQACGTEGVTEPRPRWTIDPRPSFFRRRTKVLFYPV